jgi:hypothetical protein
MNLNPFLQYRHANGFGDFIACTLHSKYINPITIAITGKDGLCAACDARRQALNVLIPIPFWKLFYKSEEERENSIKKHLYYKDENGKETPMSLVTTENNTETDDEKLEKKIQINNEEFDTKIIKNVPEIENIENYEFVNSSDVELENYILRTIVYKKI